MEHWEYNGDREGDGVPTVKVPAQPTEKERVEHETIHTPSKPWCKHCMMGSGVRRAYWSNVPDTEATDVPNKLSMDYMYLIDDEGLKDQPQVVMVDHTYGRLFEYIVPKKGILGQAEWVPSRMVRDIDNLGYRDVAIQIKSDQEMAIVAVQEHIRLHRTGPTILTNNPVGESECNGRVRNAIRRFKEKTRTLMP